MLRGKGIPLVLWAKLHLYVVFTGVVLEGLEEEDVIATFELATTFALTLVNAHLSIA